MLGTRCPGSPGRLQCRMCPFFGGFSDCSSCYCLVAQSCPTLSDPMDCSPPGSSVYGILQARILEWVAAPFSRGSSRTQGSNPHLSRLLHWEAGSSPLHHLGRPPGAMSHHMSGEPGHWVSVVSGLGTDFQHPTHITRDAGSGWRGRGRVTLRPPTFQAV